MRGWPTPEPERTVHIIGDIHFGVRSWGGYPTPANGLWKTRWDKLISDLAGGTVPTPAARVAVGDITETGGTDTAPYNIAGNQDQLAIQQIARLPAAQTTGQPTQTPKLDMVGGNHDVNYPAGTARGTAAFEAAYGIPQTGGLGHYTIDLPFARLLLVQQPRSAAANTGRLDQADLDWLDAALTAAASKDCWIITHYSLGNTVGGIQSGVASELTVFSTYNPDWNTNGMAVSGPGKPVGDDSNIRTVLGNHLNAKAWIGGHTHSPVSAPGIVTTLNLGAGATQHNLAAINASSLYYIGRTIEPSDPVRTIYVSKPSTGAPRLEVRFRNHGAGIWDGPEGAPAKLLTVTL